MSFEEGNSDTRIVVWKYRLSLCKEERKGEGGVQRDRGRVCLGSVESRQRRVMFTLSLGEISGLLADLL